MSASDVARSQRVLDKIGARLGITEPGKEWLKAAVDPFHDTPLFVKGYPDVNEAASVVQVVKMSAQISAPPSIGGANWDCHIHSFPWENPGIVVGGNYLNTNNGNPSGGNGPFLLGTSITTPAAGIQGPNHYGGIAVFSVSAGQPTFDCEASSAGATFVNPFVTELSQYLNGEYRIVAKGFEVINTTSDLNVQGLVTCYRQPCAPLDSAKATTIVNGFGIGTVNQAYAVGVSDLIQTAFPPISTAEALLLDGTKQWKAKEGCYVVPTLASDELPPGLTQSSVAMKLSSADPNRGTPPNAGTGWALVCPNNSFNIPASFQPVITVGSESTTLSPICIASSWHTNFNHAGAYFSGLSTATTLQLNVIYYVERFPSQQDSDLVVLATNSARKDCVALDLYSEIIREMPVGVPQKMNGMGQWFADAVSSAVDFVAPVLSAIPHPIAQGAAMAAKTVKNMSHAIMGKKEAPGQIYSAQGANVSASQPKKKVTERIVEVIKKKKAHPGKK